MASLNSCCFIGNLGADPEVKSFSNGGRICNLRLAVSESWKDKNTGEKKERTEWVSVSISNDGLISVAERYLTKGKKIYISGKWRTRKWTDQAGNDRYSTELDVGFDGKLVMLDSAGSSDRSSSSSERQSSSYSSSSRGGSTPSDGFDDEEIPF